ncbi:hypothetical protein J2751_001551 [Halorubrum alkaliphilum]|uniref:Uncharacterized protein n=1 Tax=Halorubrum alkaliphilum TaxID=261290 RepID=A0A8T4GGH5_9EURY|nr:hypothetical protein [Halorubrum alkaliphilum]
MSGVTIQLSLASARLNAITSSERFEFLTGFYILAVKSTPEFVSVIPAGPV